MTVWSIFGGGFCNRLFRALPVQLDNFLIFHLAPSQISIGPLIDQHNKIGKTFRLWWNFFKKSPTGIRRAFSSMSAPQQKSHGKAEGQIERNGCA